MCDATQLRKKRYTLQSSTQLIVCTLLCLLHLQFSDLASNWVHQHPALHTAKRRRAHTRFAATVKYLGKTRFAARMLGLSRCRVASSSPAANQNRPSLAASAFSLAGRSVPTHVMDCMFDYTVGASKTKLPLQAAVAGANQAQPAVRPDAPCFAAPATSYPVLLHRSSPVGYSRLQA